MKEFLKLSKRIPNIGEFSDLVNALGNHTDREIAILGASALEICLEFAITSRFPGISESDHRELFGEGGKPGVLSSFASRILIAHVISLISDDIQNDMSKIRKIRNIFAHNACEISFDNKEIAKLCNSFASIAHIDEEIHRNKSILPLHKLIESNKVQIMKDNGEILDADNYLIISDKNNYIFAYVQKPQETDRSRDRFIATVQLIWWLLMCHAAVDLFKKYQRDA